MQTASWYCDAAERMLHHIIIDVPYDFNNFPNPGGNYHDPEKLEIFQAWRTEGLERLERDVSLVRDLTLLSPSSDDIALGIDRLANILRDRTLNAQIACDAFVKEFNLAPNSKLWQKAGLKFLSIVGIKYAHIREGVDQGYRLFTAEWHSQFLKQCEDALNAC